MGAGTEVIVLGGGCFWCTEAVFRPLKGVVSAVSGYAGGTKENPTYEEVCGGETGHAEVSRVEFDPAVITLPQLLEVFFHVHDPTSLNRQGSDVGTQYRSIILYTREPQREVAQTVMHTLQAAYPKPLVTQVQRLGTFYPAEAHHQRYFEKHPDQSYCAFIIRPKVEKARAEFAQLLQEP